MRLLNSKELAAELGRKPGYVCAMKQAGFTMRYAGQDTVKNALAWLEAHPDFRSTAYNQKRNGK